MAKRMVVLVGMLIVLLVAAVPALAQQEQFTATGVLYQEQGGYYYVTDGTPGEDHLYRDKGAGLEEYVGAEVTVYGTLTADTPEAPFSPEFARPIVDVTRVESADDPLPGPPPGEETATLSFELTVKGTPPEGTRFFGSAVGEGGPGVPLTDPDSDSIFTGSVTVPRFPPGLRPVPSGTPPIALSVRIVQVEQVPFGPGEPSVIKDFGVVPLDGDKAFRAKVNFKKVPVSPEEPTDECLALSPNPEECDAYVGPGGSGSSGSGSGASVSGSGSGGGEIKASGKSSGGGTKELPRTGGAIPALSLAGALLIGGGLLIRRATR